MTPEYRIKINGTLVNAVMGDDMAKKIAKQSGEEFFRTSLTGKIALIGSDFDWLYGEGIGEDFVTVLQRRTGAVWADYARAIFNATDCKWDYDNQRVEISLRPYDVYTDLLDGMAREFNLIKLPAKRERVTFDKRAAIQVYSPGESALGNATAGTYWETACTAEVSPSIITGTHKFALSKTFFRLNLYGAGAPSAIAGDYVAESLAGILVGRNAEYKAELRTQPDYYGPGDDAVYYSIVRALDDEDMFESDYHAEMVSGTSLSFTPVSPDASGSFTGYYSVVEIYTRLVHDNAAVGFVRLTNDIAGENLNYTRVSPFVIGVDYFAITPNASDLPTELGLTQDGMYFVPPPATPYVARWIPVARNQWALSSVWFGIPPSFELAEEGYKAEITQSDFYAVGSVIKALLSEIAPSITHERTATYSEFLYGGSVSPSTYADSLFMTPKSNVLAGQYDRPAQKAPVTLAEVLEMLRALYDCYWFVDSSSRLRIEHISYFKRGGAYTGTPALTADLTALLNPKNGRLWSTGTGRWEFDKSELPEFLNLTYMDAQSEFFEGRPVQVTSPYVSKGATDTRAMNKFTADIDRMLISPSDVSKDGFLVAEARALSGALRIIYRSTALDGIGTGELQNGGLSWLNLQADYHLHNLSGRQAIVKGLPVTALGIRRAKKHEVEYPSATDPDPMKLVRTSIGDGSVESIDINLASRMNKITLRYDTE